MPAVEQLADMAANREVLLENGTRVKVRRVPHPDYLPAKQIVRLVRAREEAGVDVEDDSLAAHEIVRQSLGEQYYRGLVREGEEVGRWLTEFAASTRYRTVQIGFVELQAIIESWYSGIREALGITGRYRNCPELTNLIAKRFGMRKLSDLLPEPGHEPGHWTIELIRCVSNDVKHDAGTARQSAKSLDISPGSPLMLTITGLEDCCNNASGYARALTAVFVERLGGGPPEDIYDNLSSREHPTSPSRWWLGRFVDSKYRL